MTVENNAAAAALASLGLVGAAVTETVDVAPVEAAVETVAEVSVDAVVEAGGEAAPVVAAAGHAFASGALSDLSFDAIPELKRNFVSTGVKAPSKYLIELIAAPGTEGKKYHGKLIAYESGDITAFKRSVQSAATGQNRIAKDEGQPNYYITRAAEVDGKFAGTYVIRTDERPAEAEEATVEATTAE